MSERGRPTEFPNLKKGIVDEVLLNLASDRNKFVQETQQTLKKENEHLEKLFAFSRERIARKEDYINWSLTYYAILSRSAKNEGLPMIDVSQEIIDKIGTEVKLRSESARAKGTNPLEFLEDSMNMIGKFAKEDKAISGELGKFWNCFFEFLAESSSPETKVSSIHLGVAVYDFANTIRIQHRIDQGEQPFPQQN